MSVDLGSSHIYTDFQGLTQLRSQAREGSPDALRVVAEQFEAYLVQQLLKSGRAASLGTGILDSQQGQFYQELHDQQLAHMVTQNQGLGIADLIVNQVERQQGNAGKPAAEPSQRPDGQLKTARTATTVPTNHSLPSPLEEQERAVKTPAPISAVPGDDEERVNRRFESPEEFARELMPHARRAAAELGVDPRLLVAQAALETGWGKSIIRSGDGTSSHNLFGIKAGSRWDGPTASVGSLEFENGVMVKRQSSFRAYDSFEDSFRDYVQFLRSNPRYGDALTRTNDPSAFAQSLQQAGYATDPAYADKILNIYAMEELSVVSG